MHTVVFVKIGFKPAAEESKAVENGPSENYDSRPVCLLFGIEVYWLQVYWHIGLLAYGYLAF